MAHDEALPASEALPIAGDEKIFAAWLLSALKPALLINTGSPLDETYEALCGAVHQLGLDTRCYALAGAGEQGGAAHRQYGSNSHSVDAVPETPQAMFPDRAVDLLVLPLRGEEEGFLLSVMQWLPKLSSQGVLLVVDADGAEPPLGAALTKLRERYPSLLLGHGRVLLAVGERMPQGLRDVFGAQESGASEAAAHVRDPASASDGAPDLNTLVLQLEQQTSELERARRALMSSEERLREADSRAAAREHDVRALLTALDNATLSMRLTQQSLHYFQNEVAMLKRSRSWAVTAPLRSAFNAARSCRRVVGRMRFLVGAVRRRAAAQGWGAVSKKSVALLSSPRNALKLLFGEMHGELRPEYDLPAARPAPERLVQRVLLIAELSLPQCLKYRVMQKRQMIESLGVECTVVNWSDTVSARSFLQTHTVAIFYRVPGYPSVLETIRIARELGVPTFWEVDDLIFDLKHYKDNSNLANLDRKTAESILKGVPLYRRAMLECDAAIASTKPLAVAMQEAGVKSVHIIENALDIETSRIAEKIMAAPRRGDGLIRIVYGSGSSAHDSDFRVAAGAICNVLASRYDVRLTVIGALNLPPEFDRFAAQIERLPPSDYETYLKRLSRCHINIAPLEDTVFNDAKSNIKYLEAATLRIPSVCSATAEYRATIEHGVTGFLASTPKDWEELLLRLVDDADLRKVIGDNAHDHVQAHYTPETVAVEQVEPLLAPHRKFSPKPLRILGVNIFFEPRSFGGATIVAEEVARRINRSGDAEYAMVTTLPVSDVHAYKVVRYQSTAGEVFAMGLPGESDPALEFDNPYPVEAFRQILRAWRPDVVHIHSIQGIGVQVAEVCQAEGVPFAVTLHDAWWICARQFMVTGQGKYCHQRKIDINVCASCVPRPALNPYRQFRLREVLSGAALLMSPSEFFRGIYADNGFALDKLVVNKNGIVKPRRRPERIPPSQRPLRFGFVGGEGPIKGSHLIKKALRNLPQYTNYELRVVDNELNLGRRSIFESNWSIPGTLTIVPAYTQETIDEFFGNIDVLLFPTQWKESFGLSVREALIRDCWVIATDAGGVVEDIVAGENGDVIPLEDDGTELQRAIERLLANPGQLDGYRNVYADKICLFEDQARELTGYLASVAAKSPRPASAPLPLREDDHLDFRLG
jgi:glycosyltransferase involved in cell wall biosynthesis